MAYLRHLFNGNTVALYELGSPTVIGREASAHIRIEDRTISGQHASLNKEENRWMLVDEDSTNGTLVDGKRVAAHALTSGELFNLGTHAFQFLEELPSELDKTMKIKKSWIPGIYYTES